MWLLIRYGYAISAIGFVSACIISRVRRWRRRKPVIAFLHPYCAAGGGGERVLWVAISAVLEAKGASFAAAKLKLCVAETRAVRLVIYTGDRGVRAETIREKAKCQFGVQVPREIELCYTTCRRLIEPSLYPVATLFGQSIGSMVLALDCMLRLPPDVLIDTTGLAFSYPVALLVSGCSIGAYVHYPTVSKDMTAAVSSRVAAFNNRTIWARWTLLTGAKLAYYSLFTAAYGAAGRCASAVMANSTWTKAHVSQIWSGCDVKVVYPPCDTQTLVSTDCETKAIKPLIVFSLAQFRPEKNHRLQLEAWARLTDDVRAKATLIIAGAVRHAEDEGLLVALRDEAKRRGLDGSIQFLVDAPRHQIVDLVRRASIGLHTMRLEHFGIAIVEMMAARVVPVAHKSGGPLLDIVGDARDRGFVADNAQDYADAIATLIHNDQLRNRMADNARNFVRIRFSDASFSRGFVEALSPTLSTYIREQSL